MINLEKEPKETPDYDWDKMEVDNDKTYSAIQKANAWKSSGDLLWY